METKNRKNPPLFIDDLRPSPGLEWAVVRSYEEAITYVQANGCPPLISFDHDLGEGPTGYDFAKWLIEQDMATNKGILPDGFSYRIHSANPVGRQNLASLLDRFLNQRPQLKAAP